MDTQGTSFMSYGSSSLDGHISCDYENDGDEGSVNGLAGNAGKDGASKDGASSTTIAAGAIDLATPLATAK